MYNGDDLLLVGGEDCRGSWAISVGEINWVAFAFCHTVQDPEKSQVALLDL